METNFSLVAMIQQGWYATYPLIAISVLMLTVVLERAWTLFGVGAQAARIERALIQPLREGKLDEALKQTGGRRSPAERVFHALLEAARFKDREELIQVDEERRFEEVVQLRHYIWILGTAGASAPFIGLFGTVVGIMESFQSMATMGTGGFSVVAAGISEALISTAFGLAVAIIAVIFYNYFNIKIEYVNSVLRIGAARIIEAALHGRTLDGD